MNKTVKLNEKQFHNVVNNSVKRILSEITIGGYRKVEKNYRELWEGLLNCINLKELETVKDDMEFNIEYRQNTKDPRYKKAYESVCTLVDILKHVEKNFDTAYSKTASAGFGSEFDTDSFYDDPDNDDKELDDMDVSYLRKKYPFTTR